MSGHSKWSKVKHQKEATDKAKGKTFTKFANAIIIAVKEGGANPETNFKLRLAIEKAKGNNIPKENIERAIEKGKGTESGEGLTEVVYEAFGPGGVGMIIQAVTDNKQRTVAELKNILTRMGVHLATPGSVLHLFELVGCIETPQKEKNYDEVMEVALESGAIDLAEKDDSSFIYTNPHELHRIKEELLTAGLSLSSFELIYRPKTLLHLSDQTARVQELVSILEERDDIQKVFVNCDIS